MDDHLSPDELSQLAREGLRSERMRALAHHILRACPACLAMLSPLVRQPEKRERAELSPEEDAAYEAAIQRAFSAAMRHERRWRRDRERAREIVRRIEAGGPEALMALPRWAQGAVLVEALLERSWALRHDDPAQMVELARYAVLVACQLDVQKHGIAQTADLQCRAWADLGNACRVAEDHGKAQECFDQALECYLRGTNDELLLARVLDLQSSLYRAERDFPTARTALSLVYDIYRRHGQRHLAGRALTKIGILTGNSGEPEEACRLIRRGLLAVDEREEADLVFTAIHNLIWFAVDCDRFEEAERDLFLNRRRYREAGGRLNQLKLRWLEARIDAGRGRIARAAETFREVAEGFEEASLGYQAALASLYLAEALLRQEEVEEARQVALQAAETFQSLKIHREAMAAVLFLRRCFRRRQATAAVVKSVITFLRRAEHDPTARFQPPAALTP